MYLSSKYFLVCLNIFLINGEDTAKAHCDSSTSVTGVVQYICPPSPYSTKTSIHVYSGLITIDCYNAEVLDDTVLPRGNHNNIIKIVMKDCPLPANGFKYLVNRFNITSLRKLTLTMNSAAHSTINGNDFFALVDLDSLELSGSNILNLNDSIFKNTPNLSVLKTNNNQIRLNEDLFDKIPNLTELSIVRSNITYIPKRFFNKLIKLEKLTIQNNRIRTLESGVFDDLKNLKDLDLSSNGIEIIEEDAFKNLTNLVNLTLNKNQLKNVTRKIFESCRRIERISLDNNPNVILHEAAFSQFDKLKEINLSNNLLKNIPENLFNGSTNLLIIYLSNNSLETLEKNVFKSSKSLEELHLDGNEIKILHSDVFATLTNLKKLYLQYNQIERLDKKLLTNMANLVEMNFSHNQIKFSSRSQTLAFRAPDVDKLKIVDLSHNKILFYPAVLNDRKKMEKLDLRNNFIEKVHLMSMLARKVPNSRNLVIDLDSNKITSVEIDTTDLNQERLSNTIITITNNPILCDCSALNLAMFLQGNHKLNSYVRFEPKDVQCSGKMAGKILNEIEMIDLTCQLQRNCSSNSDCNCLRRSFDNSLIVNCSSRGLTVVPYLIPDELSEFDNIIVHLDGNRLKESPGEHNGFGNVTELYLQKNEISNITWIPVSLKILNLSENAMSSLNEHSLELLNRSMVEKLSLGYNPWMCDCEITGFIEYLRSHVDTVDSSEIRCETNGIEMIKLNKNDLCASNKKLILIVSLSVLALFLLVTCSTALYFKYKKQILIWLFYYGSWLYRVDEEEIDEDKIYDAFVSYSHHDEDFVLNNIVSTLETGPEPYKLCVHVRDFIPGEYIKTQITNSIRTSKRTIVFLSPSFLESVWGKLEFKTAHTEAMLEGRARVIVIIYGDVNLETVDDDLKSHIKANTYVKWGDPWFWKKLKYALPKRRRRTLGNCNKHANMTHFVDDKNNFKRNGANPQRVDNPSIVSVPNTIEDESLTSLMRC